MFGVSLPALMCVLLLGPVAGLGLRRLHPFALVAAVVALYDVRGNSIKQQLRRRRWQVLSDRVVVKKATYGGHPLRTAVDARL